MNVFENCGRCFGASFGDCEDCMKRREEQNKMSEYVKRDDVFQALVDCDEVRGFAFKMIEERINEIPAAQVISSNAVKEVLEDIRSMNKSISLLNSNNLTDPDDPYGELEKESRYCINCYYETFDASAYPCSMCIRGEERTDMFQPRKK